MHARPAKQITHLDPAILVEKSPSILEPQIFIDYLNLYVTYRETTRSTTMGRVKTGLGIFAAAVKGEDPIEIQISDIISTVMSDLRATKAFDEWYELIFIIRAKAEDCKKHKTTYEFSLSWLTLHALADFIIGELYRVNTSLTDKVKELKAEIAKLEAYNDNCLEEANENNESKQKRKGRQGKGVAENNKKIQDLMYRLAMLGDPKYINQAMREKLIDPQQVTNATELKKFNAEGKGNYAAPLCLQRHLCEWLYELKYQPLTKIDFNRFIETSLKKGLLQSQEALIEQEAASKDRLKVAQAYIEKEEAEKKMSSQPKLNVDDEILKTLSPLSSDETKILAMDEHSSESNAPEQEATYRSQQEEDGVEEAVEQETIAEEIGRATHSPSVFGQGNLTLYNAEQHKVQTAGEVDLSTQVDIPTSPKLNK